jgi:chitodextrinase
LASDTTYWFAVEAYDEVPNYGGVSNSPSAITSSDTTPPSAISDLATSNPTGSSITLTWTAPGDDGMTGNATGYIVKYSTSGSITASNWGSATTYTQSWTPAKNGTTETHTVTGLDPGTEYWFAVDSYDEAPNYSGVSNSPSATTTATTTTTGGGGGLPILVIAGAVAVAAVVILVAVIKTGGKGKRDR